MMNVMTIGGYKAVLSFDTETAKFRGQFVGLTSEVVFEGTDVAALQHAGELALEAFLAECERSGAVPAQAFTGTLALNIPSKLHEAAAVIATANGVSIEQWVTEVLEAAASSVIGPLQ
ncbi:hypothetical protein FQZ97_1083630 [compost metagenome]